MARHGVVTIPVGLVREKSDDYPAFSSPLKMYRITLLSLKVKLKSVLMHREIIYSYTV